MINEPPANVLQAADLDGIDRIYREARALEREGKLTEASFVALWAKGLKASRGDKALLQTLAMLRP